MPFHQKALFNNKFFFLATRFAWAFLIIPLLIAATNYTFLRVPLHTIAIKQPPNDLLTIRAALTPALAIQGSLIVRYDHDMMSEIVFTIASPRGEPVNVADGALTINYRDPNQQLANLAWSSRFQGDHDQDNFLEDKELVQLTIPLAGVLKTKVAPATSFAVDVISANGHVLTVQRTLPAELNQINDLN